MTNLTAYFPVFMPPGFGAKNILRLERKLNELNLPAKRKWRASSEIGTWMKENIFNPYAIYTTWDEDIHELIPIKQPIKPAFPEFQYVIIFENENDAMLFKLRWV